MSVAASRRVVARRPALGTPDERKDVRRAVLAVVAVAGILLAVFLLIPRDYYTGTNSVRTRGMLLELSPATGRVMCFPGLRIPAGTGRMEFEIDTGGASRSPLAFTLHLGGRQLSSKLAGGPGGRQKVDFPFPKTAASPATQTARACVRRLSNHPTFFGGVPGIAPGEQPPLLDSVPMPNRAAIWYRPPAGDRGSILFHAPELMRREALFKPSWTGAWTYWVLFFAVAPAIAWLAIRLLLDPRRRRRLPLALAIALVAFANAAVWAHVTPAFNAPDESEHFAYTQSLVERGKPLERAATARPTYSSDEALAIRMTRIFDSNETTDGKPPWDAGQQRIYDRLEPKDHLKRDDGGGFAAAGSSHSPAYYALTAPAYALAGGGSVFDQLVAMRLVSALLGAIVAACAVLIVLELVPGRPRVAAAAGLAVAFQPMFAFMSGSVNNDMGVNAGAAVVTLLAVRTIHRGFTLPRAAALGVMLALTPLLKATGFAVLPAAALAVLLAVWRYRPAWRRWLPGVAAVVLGFGVVWEIWTHVSASLDRGTFTTPNGQAPGEGFLAFQHPSAAFAYVWEVFLPRLPGMNEHWSQSWPAYDIYGIRGWGAFGWYALTWRHRVYWVIMAVLAVMTVLGFVALWRRRGWTRRNVPELLVLVAVVLGVIGVMNAAYYSELPQGALYPQQGRYVFPAMAALATLFFGSTFALRRRWVEPLAAALSTAVICFGYASLWFVLAGFYFVAG